MPTDQTIIDKLADDLNWLIDEIDRADSDVEFGALAMIGQDYVKTARLLKD